MKIHIRCFASVRELFGTESFDLEVAEGTDLQALRSQLAADQPEFLRLPLAYAVNQDYAEASRVLQDGDEVAFIPPISGGHSSADLYRFDLSPEPLDPRSLEAEVRADTDGAIVTFAGVTRNHNEGDAVLSLRYECYEPMARKVMGQIFEQAVKRFEISRARVLHRLGEVPIGEASVLVVVASVHRGPAFEACRYLMDQLKAEVPIFKQELLAGEDGASRWVGDLPSGLGS